MKEPLKAALVEYFLSQAKNFAPFSKRKLSGSEKANFSAGNPILCFTKRCVGRELYFLIVGHRDSMFTIECGWKVGEKFPVACDDYNKQFASHTKGEPLPTDTDFAIRLFRLSNRGELESFWDLYWPRVLVEGKESFQEFRRKMFRERVDYQDRIAVSGAITVDVAQRQAELVGGDAVQCLLRFGIPFLHAHAKLAVN